MGFALTQAQVWLARRGDDIGKADQAFIKQSRNAAQRRKRRVQALVGVLVAAMAAGAAAWWNERPLKEEIQALDIRLREAIYAWRNATPLDAARESALKAGELIPKECRDCPEMIVVPALAFKMGSPAGEA